VKNGIVMALTTNRASAQAWLANDRQLRDFLEL
jgi:hypothetical protein